MGTHDDLERFVDEMFDALQRRTFGPDPLTTPARFGAWCHDIIEYVDRKVTDMV